MMIVVNSFPQHDLKRLVLTVPAPTGLLVLLKEMQGQDIMVFDNTEEEPQTLPSEIEAFCRCL